MSQNSAGRHGGGIYNNDLADVTVSDSTITSNSAGIGGGGLFNELAATATIANSTVAFNQATQTVLRLQRRRHGHHVDLRCFGQRGV